MSEIQEEAYSEACEEIKRLQDELRAALDSRRQEIERLEAALERCKGQLARIEHDAD
jgi:prefoldin subunit 5